MLKINWGLDPIPNPKKRKIFKYTCLINCIIFKKKFCFYILKYSFYLILKNNLFFYYIINFIRLITINLFFVN